MPCPMVVCLESSETYQITHSDRMLRAYDARTALILKGMRRLNTSRDSCRIIFTQNQGWAYIDSASLEPGKDWSFIQGS